MNRNEIMAMTPQQLENEIARLKGWNGSDFDGPTKWEYVDGAYQPNRLNWVQSIGDAWELVEEMGKGFHVDIVKFVDERWAVYLSDIYLIKVVISGGITAPLAICRAWLMWKNAK